MVDNHYIKTILNALLAKIKSIRFDWNVNDPSQEGYIKNRTHYKENATRLVVDNLSSSSLYDGNIPICNFTPKWTYDVIYNGTLYEGLICYPEDEYNCIGGYGKYPFYIDDDGGNSFFINCEDDEFTVSITEHAVIIHKLDEEYLPDGLITKDELSEVAISGSYYDLNDTPTVPTNISQLTNDTGYLTSVPSQYVTETELNAKGYLKSETDPTVPSWAKASKKPTYTYSEITDKPILVGQNVEGTGYTINNAYVAAGEGAEIFNDYENNKASGRYSHAEGQNTTASGIQSHAEGCYTTASAQNSHVEGYFSTASGNHSHAEGGMAKASGEMSHAEGCSTESSGSSSHAEGRLTVAAGMESHAQGYNTIANGKQQHVQGRYNIEDTENKYAHIVGNGSYTSDGGIRSNAHTLDWQGNAWFAGDVYVSSTSGTNKDEGSKKLATEEYVDIRVPAWTSEDEGKILRIVNGTPTWTSMDNVELISTQDIDEICSETTTA